MTLDQMPPGGMATSEETIAVLERPEEIPGTGVVIGIDSGTRSIGVAVSDPERRVASPIGSIRRRTFRELADNLRPIIQSRQATAIIVGLPRLLSGKEGASAQSARAVARNLARELQLPVALWDERLSTAAAERALLEDDVGRRRRRQLVDGVAAAFILQGALDRMSGANLRNRT